MTLHYHGTPITPRSIMYSLTGRNFCVSHADPRDVELCHQIGQSVMLDNGAFSAWRRGAAVNWPDYYDWTDHWLGYRTTWAVIPDTITGSEEENDRLIEQWPHGDRGAPVWHLHESLDRLERLATNWPRICFGSSGHFQFVGTDAWRRRMDEAMQRVVRSGRPITWLHMLRGMRMSGDIYPFASVDSADIARNHNGHRDPARMADRWDGMQCPGTWSPPAGQPGLPI